MTAPFRKILSPVYFDEMSPIALEYVRHFAQHSTGTIYLLHVVPTDEFHLLRRVYQPEQGGGADARWAEKVARERLEALAHEHLSGVQYEIVTRLSGDPATGILEAEKEVGADLVVMATHGRTGLAHLILGSVAERVVRSSTCPVFTTRRGERLSSSPPFQRILVPVDIAEGFEAALTCAGRIAEQSSGTVYPLHVVPTDESDLLLRDVYRAGPEAKANLVLAEKMAKQKLGEIARKYLSGVRYETVLHVSGDPAKTILEVEGDIGADLLVMATHGLTGLLRLILRSLTERMMREAHCPVLSLHQ